MPSVSIPRILTSAAYSLILFFSLVAYASAGALYDLNGQKKRVEDYLGHGKWTVVMFWASDCHICHLKAPDYVAFQEKHKNDNIRMLGMVLDGKANKADAEAFIREYKVNFPNLTGDPEDVAGFYQDNTGSFFVGTPTFMIYSPDGEVRAADSGAVPVNVIEDFIASQTANE